MTRFATAGPAALLLHGESNGRKRVSKRDLESKRTSAPAVEGASDEVRRIPLHSEAVHTDITLREIGSVRIHKRVRTEMRQLSVPVRVEEVTIERLERGQAPDGGVSPPSAPIRPEATLPSEPFVEGTFRMQLCEEEVEVVLRPVVREIVVISKRTLEERSSHEVTLRHEHASVEATGDAEWTLKGDDPGDTRH